MPRVDHEPVRVTCSDGWSLSVELVLPDEPRAVAIVGHAMMVDRRTLNARGDGLVGHLAAAGIAVVWPDLRGHGRSGPHVAEGGRWSYDDLVERDTPALIATARERFSDLPIVAVGHSLFGHVALAYFARHPEAALDGLALIAANVWARRWDDDPARRMKKRLALEAMGALTRLCGYFPSRGLRIGPCDESAEYIAQTVGFIRHGWNARDGFSYSDAAERLRCPLLTIAGAGDRLLCAPDCARRFGGMVAGAEHLTVGRSSGLEFDPGHMELVVDARCRPVWQRVADFILARARNATA